MKVKKRVKFIPCIIMSLLIVLVVTASASAEQYGASALLGSVSDMWGHTYQISLLYTPSSNGPSTEYEYKVVYGTYTKIIIGTDEFKAFFPNLLDARQKYTTDNAASKEAAEAAYEYTTGSEFETPAPAAPTIMSAATSTDGQSIIITCAKPWLIPVETKTHLRLALLEKQTPSAPLH